jgi:hypothetical protein
VLDLRSFVHKCPSLVSIIIYGVEFFEAFDSEPQIAAVPIKELSRKESQTLQPPATTILGFNPRLNAKSAASDWPGNFLRGFSV